MTKYIFLLSVTFLMSALFYYNNASFAYDNAKVISSAQQEAKGLSYSNGISCANKVNVNDCCKIRTSKSILEVDKTYKFANPILLNYLNSHSLDYYNICRKEATK